LPLTFQDNDGRTYASWAGGQSPYRENPITGTRYGKTWSNVQEYTKAVQARTGTHSLWKHDLGAAKRPEPGDLMIMVKVQRLRMYGQDIEIFEEGHAALVYATYSPGVAHPLKAHKDIPDFPGHDVAKKEVHQFEYFRGRAVSKNPWQIDREADTADHVDYLNSRSDAKRIGELIYFASAQDMRNDGFEFRWWADHVFQ
jgi:hypothetical protein